MVRRSERKTAPPPPIPRTEGMHQQRRMAHRDQPPGCAATQTVVRVDIVDEEFLGERSHRNKIGRPQQGP